jgi:hypothetical protein
MIDTIRLWSSSFVDIDTPRWYDGSTSSTPSTVAILVDVRIAPFYEPRKNRLEGLTAVFSRRIEK